MADILNGFEWVNGYLGTEPWELNATWTYQSALPLASKIGIAYGATSRIATGIVTASSPDIVFNYIRVMSSSDYFRVRFYNADTDQLYSTVLNLGGSFAYWNTQTVQCSDLPAGNFRLVFEVYCRAVTTMSGWSRFPVLQCRPALCWRRLAPPARS
ncbi:MAG: hypothetical protein LBF50_08850 [Azoarcus sp.]|jgi:hypothetical protein|nr:hypothetical protein [Azoarcus sp.]